MCSNLHPFSSDQSFFFFRNEHLPHTVLLKSCVKESASDWTAMCVLAPKKLIKAYCFCSMAWKIRNVIFEFHLQHWSLMYVEISNITSVIAFITPFTWWKFHEDYLLMPVTWQNYLLNMLTYFSYLTLWIYYNTI